MSRDIKIQPATPPISFRKLMDHGKPAGLLTSSTKTSGQSPAPASQRSRRTPECQTKVALNFAKLFHQVSTGTICSRINLIYFKRAKGDAKCPVKGGVWIQYWWTVHPAEGDPAYGRRGYEVDSRCAEELDGVGQCL